VRRRRFVESTALSAGTALAAGCGVTVRMGGAAATPTDVPDDQVPRIDVAAAFQAISAGQAVLIDVRSAEAWRGRHAKGAVSLPLDDIEKLPSGAMKTLPAAKRPILYCT
jgi:hypothetical protein